MHLNHPAAPPGPGLWKNCLPRNQSLVPKRLGTTALQYCFIFLYILKILSLISFQFTLPANCSESSLKEGYFSNPVLFQYLGLRWNEGLPKRARSLMKINNTQNVQITFTTLSCRSNFYNYNVKDNDIVCLFLSHFSAVGLFSSLFFQEACGYEVFLIYFFSKGLFLR